MILAFCASLAAAVPAAARQVAVNQDAQILAALDKRLKDYAALHDKLEATLPRLSNDAEAKDIDAHQRALAALIQKARPDPDRGEIFGPAARALIRRLIARTFSGPDAATLRDALEDENPGRIRLRLNDRIPGGVSRPTMPPQVLQMLPKLPDALEYRFVGDRLVLVDAHAQIVVDIVNDALPK